MTKKPIDLRIVASRQRFLIRLFLGYLAAYLGLLVSAAARLPFPLMYAFPILIIILNIVVLVAIVNLMAALGYHIILRILCIVGLFIPLINLLLLLTTNRKATRVLKRAGIKVRFLGAPENDVIRVLSSDLCKNCLYDMTGNVSGICPECGTPWIRPTQPPAEIAEAILVAEALPAPQARRVPYFGE